MTDNRDHMVDGRLSFGDFIDADRLRTTLERFRQTTGLAPELLSCPDNAPIVEGSLRALSERFDRFLPKSEILLKQSREIQSSTNGEPYFLYQDNELAILAAPVFTKGVQVAHLISGPFLLTKPSPTLLKKQAKDFGHEAPGFVSAIEQLPLLTEDAARNSMVLLKENITLLAELCLGKFIDRDLADEAARDRENLRTTLNSIGDAVIATDKHGAVTRMNPVAEKLTGWTLDQARGKPLEQVLNIFNAITGEKAVNPVARVLKSGNVVGLANHTKLLSKDGTEYQIADSAAPIRNRSGSIDGVVLVFRDVTEEYRTQEELQRALVSLKDSEERLRDASMMAHLGHWHWDVNTGHVEWSDEVYRIFHLNPNEFTPQIDSILALSPWPEDHARDKELIQKAIESREPGAYEQRFLRPDGSTGYYYSTFQGMYDDDGELTSIKGTVQDITDRKRASAATEESEAKHRLFVENYQGIAYQADAEHHVPDLIEGIVEEITGYDAEAFRDGKINWINIVHQEDIERVSAEFDTLTSNPGHVAHTEYRILHKNGEVRWVRDVGRLVRLQNRNMIQGTVVDITPRKQAEEALRESEARVRTKLNAIMSPEGDISSLELADIMDTAALQGLMDDFCGLTGLAAAVLDTKGKILLAQNWQDICTKFHRVHPATCQSCVESDTVLSSGVAPGECKLYRCKNNMCDVATPIIIGDKHMGNVFMGQFFLEGEEIDYDDFRKRACEHGFDEKEYMAALDRVPKLARDKIDMAMSFYSKLSVLITGLSYGNIKLARTLADQHHAEEALRESEEHFRMIVDASNDAIIVINNRGLVSLFNTAAEKMFGRRAEDMIGQSVDCLMPQTFRSDHARDVASFFATGKPNAVIDRTVEVPAVKANGEVFPIEISLACGGGGDQASVVGVIRDITSRKLAEEQLASANTFLDTIVDLSPFAMWVSDKNGTIIRTNHSLRKALGLKNADLVGKYNIFQDANPEQQGVRHLIDAVFEKNQTARFSIEWKASDAGDADFHTARNLHIDVSMFPILDSSGNLTNVVCQWVDITDRKLAEQALIESEERYRNFIANASEGIYRVDLPTPIPISSSDQDIVETVSRDAIVGEVNEALARMYGLHIEDMIGHPAIQFAPDYGMRALHVVRSPSLQIREMETLDVDKDGLPLHLSESYSAVVEDGKLIRIWGMQQDITERKKAQKALAEAQNYITNIIDSMPSVLVGVDSEGKVTQWNKTTEQATGISAKSALGQQLDVVLPQMKSEMESIAQSIRSRTTLKEVKKPRQVGDAIAYEDMTIYPLIANGVDGAVIRIDDVTDKVRMEEMMIQSEKMLSVGGLAAGMAHEINNPLAGMMQTAEVMINRLRSEDMPANIKAAAEAGISMEEIRAYMESRGILRMLNSINDSGRRVADIVENMLSFARKGEAGASTHNLAELIDKTLELASTDYDLKRQYDFKAIEINRDYEGNMPPVQCEAGKIQQVLLNILRNGAQAMQEAPTKDMEGKPRFDLRLAHETEAGMVRIEIADNGPGMDEETRKRVFEPFFTTKPVGTGTGLGLSVSYFIITENHKGELSVESELGNGTTYIIRLPINRTDVAR